MINYTNFAKVLYMNCVITFHFSLCIGLVSQLPLIASLNHYESLGQISLICLYLTNLAFNLLGPSYLSKLSYRIGFLLQALLSLPAFIPMVLIVECDAHNIIKAVCEPWLMYIMCIVGCILLGASFGGYFVIQNSYISDCSDASNKELFFGMGYMFLGAAYLLNGIETNIFLAKLGVETYFTYGGFIQIFFSLLFYFVPQPVKTQNSKVHSQLELQSSVVSRQNNDLIDPDRYQQVEKQKIVKEQFSTLELSQQFRIMYNKTRNYKMLQILPLFMATGCVVGYEFGFFYKLIQMSLQSTNTDEISTEVANVFVAVGFGQVISGIGNGISINLFGVIDNSILYANLLQITLILSIINVYQMSFTLNYVIGALIGFTDNSGQITVAVLISQEWRESMAIYGIYLFFQNFSVVTINIITMFTEHDSLMIYNFIFVFLVQMIVKFNQHLFKRYTSS